MKVNVRTDSSDVSMRLRTIAGWPPMVLTSLLTTLWAVPAYVKKLFDNALKICSGSKLINYCYTSKFLWCIFKKLLFNFDIFNNFYKNRRFIELLLANFSQTKRGNPVGAASL